MPDFADARVVCRPALPSDTADVLEFTRRIWDGRDYIHWVWDEWLADPKGLLISAQFGPRVIGIAKITPVFPGQWWLHGLRVNPDYHGLKIGSHLHDYLDRWWLQHGDGMLRLLTSTQRVQVHRLCERTGYRRVGQVTAYRRLLARDAGGAADGTMGKEAGTARARFEPVLPEMLAEALDFSREWLVHTEGLMDTGWRFVRPDEASLADRVRQSHLHWWRGREGLMATWEGDDDDGPVLGIGLAAVRDASMLAALLQDCVSLADGIPVGALFWLAPAEAAVQSALKTAGYVTDEDSGVLFEKRHPLR
ncbi:MAG TPA: GNAT family N-acetyltransferase [Anaerolineales bacterium]|nr:GNAT family N-acetyltransferase [Anaerolineales bacterium]